MDPWAAFPDADTRDDRDEWATFPDANDQDEWAGFEDAEPARTPSPVPQNRPKRPITIPDSFTAPKATDGDTLRDGDFRLRLQGIDAPELDQRGWRSDGSTVPLGELSRDYLDEQLYSPENLSMAAQARPSWGRAVAPLLNDGRDVGLGSLRAGQSFAAPEYITDEDERFDYLEAQRIARQNRLGVHGTVTLSPDEYRKNPDYVPDRRETALFADMPTPHAGLSADQEQEWLALLHTGTAQQIEDYARSVGMGVDAERNRKWVAERDKFAAQGNDVRSFVDDAVHYGKGPRPVVDPEDGQLGAIARQYASGLALGALDELKAGADTLGLTTGRENLFNSDRRFGDIYWNNLAQNQSIQAHDRMAYPTSSMLSEIAGGFTGGFALPFAAGARTIPQLARVGAGYGGLSGFLGTDGNLADRATGAAIGTTVGFVADPALGKLVDAAAPVARNFYSRMRGQPSQTAPASDPSLYSRGNMAMAAQPQPSQSLDLPRPIMEPNTRANLMASTANIRPQDLLPADRSAPADAQPFPPVEAYEDWAGPAASRIGNLDVSRLDSPQDISRALNQTYRALGGFDAATRGRISQGETEALAADLGMTANLLLARRDGQAFNAEQALAARQILAKSGNELVNAARRMQSLEVVGDDVAADFREKLVRHAAIQEQVAGITAEAGRTLQQFKQAANSRAVTSEVLGAFVRGGGGHDDLKDAAGALLDAVEMGPGKFNTLAGKVNDPKFRDKASELYINFLLTNPPTHVVNMVGNSLTTVAQIPEYAVASGIGAARRAVGGEQAKEAILASEVGARAFGLIQGIREGASLFAKALKTGEADDFASKVEGDQYKAIGGPVGEVVRLPTRFLTAEDQFFKGLARRMELSAQAVRVAQREGLQGEARQARIAELVANPTDDMLARAMDYGRYLTFQRQLGPIGQRVSGITNESLAAKVVVPFVRTPINLLKFATERSPVAPVLKEWRDDFAAGGDRRDLAIAKSVIGSGFAAVFYQAAQEGIITGSAPSDPNKRRLLYADGWQPYSIKVGDRYISYSRMDPFSTTLGVAADMATLSDGMSETQRENMEIMFATSIMSNLASKTWLSGVSSLTEAMADPQRYAGSWLERTAGSIAVPAIVAGAARQVDPVLRDRDGVGEAIQSRIPGMSSDLLPRRDVFGEPIETDSLGPDFISPFWQSQSKSDPVVAEMLRLGQTVSKVGRQYREDGERLEYSPERYDRYQELAGRFTYNGLLALIGSRGYESVGDKQRQKLAEKTIKHARQRARELIDDPDYPLPPRGGLVGSVSDPWDGFYDAQDDEWDAFPDDPDSSAGDEWDAFEDADQRDVVGSIRQAIPGVRITSGYRTREYQDDMRRRGYKPAQNSAHLSGSALDLVPPPGMTMEELADRVQQVEPDAYMLIKNDHLHVEFPDWQGAPAFDGAREAGVRNPALVQ